MHLLWFLLLAVPACAQTIDPATIGRAGAHDLSLKSGSALLWNPAVLGQTRPYRWSIDLPAFAGAAGNNAFSVSYWNTNLASDTFFDASEKADILSRIPDKGWHANAQASFPLVGFSYNRFGFNATLEAAGNATMPRELLQLALLGNEIDRRYAFADAANDATVYNDYSAGFGYRFDQEYVPELTFGVGFHYYHGFWLSKVQQSQFDLLTTDTTLSGSGLLHTVTSRRGDGVGFDLGGMAALSDQWQVGLAVRQIGARMTWQVNENMVRSFHTDSAGVRMEDLHSSSFLDSALNEIDLRFPGGSVETGLAPVVQANGRYVPRAGWSLLADVTARTRESVKGPAGVDISVAGILEPMQWLALQAGVGTGILWGPRLGIGAGLRFSRYELDAGWSWHRGVLDGARGVSAGLTHRIRF